MKQFLTFAFLVIILAGCSKSQSTTETEKESSPKISPAAEIFCNYFDDVAKQMSAAKNVEEVAQISSNIDFNKATNDINKYADDKVTDDDKAAMKNSIKHMCNAAADTSVRLLRESGNNVPSGAMENYFNKLSEEICAKIDQLETFADFGK